MSYTHSNCHFFMTFQKQKKSCVFISVNIYLQSIKRDKQINLCTRYRKTDKILNIFTAMIIL